MMLKMALQVMILLILLMTVPTEAQSEKQTIVQQEIQVTNSKFYVYTFVPLTAVAVLLIGFCMVKINRQGVSEEALV